MIYDFKASGNYFNLDFDIQLEKDQQVYCFIGENGVGKTKLLQTLAGFSLYKHSMFDYYQTRENGKFSQLKSNEGLFNQIKKQKISISDKIYFNHGYTEYDNAHRATLVAIEDIDNRSEYFGNRQTIDKPVIFISARNRGYISGLNDSRTLRLDGSRTERFVKSFLHTYNSIYDKEIETDSVTNWLLQRLVMANPAISGTEGLRKEVTFVLECLNKFAPELKLLKYDTDNKAVINCSYENGDFYIAGIAIQNLSTGYASILRIIQEIVAGISDWDNATDLYSAEGIVFIDEIDLHLHPKWQFRIIDLLKEFFPKVTFYITTHSPLVLFNLKNGEGYKLHKDEKNLVTAEKVEQSNMQFINDFISRYFISRLDKKHNDVDFNDSKDKLLELIGRLDIKDSDNDY